MMSVFEKFTGLTFSEHMQIKKLKKKLAMIGKSDGRNISTQRTITFEKMYHDGICKVKKNYYTKMIEFYDLVPVLGKVEGGAECDVAGADELTAELEFNTLVVDNTGIDVFGLNT